MLHRVGVLVYERSPPGGLFFQGPKAEAKQNALLHPGIHAPAGRRGRVRRGGAYFAALEGRAQGKKGSHRVGVSHGGRSGGKLPLDGRLQLENSLDCTHCISSLSTRIGQTGQNGRWVQKQSRTPWLRRPQAGLKGVGGGLFRVCQLNAARGPATT